MTRPCLQGCRKGRQRLIAAGTRLCNVYRRRIEAWAETPASHWFHKDMNRYRAPWKELAISRFDGLRRIPLHLRGLVRRNEAGFIGLAGLAGGIAGLSVAALLGCANLLHRWLFGHPHLSSLTALDSPFLAIIPLAGGLIIGISGIYVRKWMPRRPVDPIEANALQGGRMSLKDSLLIAAQTVISNGFGASVGLEAAYTQMGSGFASWLGTAFRLRRGDMRTLVACGSAGAIGAAFGAPLTGAFYAFRTDFGDLYAVRSCSCRRGGGLRGSGFQGVWRKWRIHDPNDAEIGAFSNRYGTFASPGDHLRAVRDPHDAGRHLGRADLRAHCPAARAATRARGTDRRASRARDAACSGLGPRRLVRAFWAGRGSLGCDPHHASSRRRSRR